MTELLTRADDLTGDSWVRLRWFLAPSVLIGALVITWSAILPWQYAVLILGASVATAVPGVFVARVIYHREASPWMMSLLIGPSWGYGLTSLVLMSVHVAGPRNSPMLLVAPIVAGGLGLAAAWRFKGLVRAPAFTRRDVAAVCLLLTLVPAIVARPYARVGAETPAGQVWRAYFTADVVWAVAVVAEVSKGDVPPKNPFRFGDSLHYYWLAHMVPALEHRLAGTHLEIRQILLANAVLSALAFTAFLFLFARHFVSSAAAAALGCAFVIVCHSFEGIQQLGALWYLDAPLGLVRDVNIDAVTHWVYQGMPIDGLQRLLLYQPQHQLGYVVGFSALLVLLQARDRLHIRVGAFVGSLLALSLLLSTFSALMLTVIAAVWMGIDVVRRRAWANAVRCAIAAAVPLVAAVALGNFLQYVEHGGSLVSFGVNPLALHRWPLVLFLSLGGVALAAGLGAVLAVHARQLSRYALPGLMISVCLLFYFCVDVRDHKHVYVGWRAGHLILIAAIPLVAAAFQHGWRLSPGLRFAGLAALAIIALLAVPTTVIDLYNTQDITNFEQAPHNSTMRIYERAKYRTLQ